jgi:hypothetical protein
METPVREEFPWRELLKAAMIELDRVKLRERIEEARAAIHARLKELEGSDGADRLQEQSAIAGAFRSLQVLEQVEFTSAIQGSAQSRGSSTREAS